MRAWCSSGGRDVIAFVTGGTGGLGQAICRALSDAGHAVAIGYRTRRDEAVQLARELGQGERCALAVALEVADAADMHAAVERVSAATGGIDILVNAAVHNVDGLIGDVEPADVDRMHAVNVTGTLNSIRAALPFLVASGQGRIINFSSVVATRADSGMAVYADTKGAVEGLTRALAVELGPKRITVNALAPGYIDAGLGHRPVAAAGERLRTLVPLRRAGRAEEVAAVVAFLASRAADYVTGTVIPVDGGLLAGSRFLSSRAAVADAQEEEARS
jgi:3-oxoacyl-[acyl-carrier protein] reductase